MKRLLAGCLGVTLGFSLTALPCSAKAACCLEVAPPGEASGEQLDGWVKQLGQKDQREGAIRNLWKTADKGVEKLAAAAESDAAEVSEQSLDLLKRFFSQGSDEARAAAQKVLKKLSTSTNKQVAERAASALKAPQQEPEIGKLNGLLAQWRAIQEAVANQFGGNVSIADMVVEGKVGDTSVRVALSQSGGAKVRVTEKGKSSEYEGKNFRELNQKHPEAVELLQKVEQWNRQVQSHEA